MSKAVTVAFALGLAASSLTACNSEYGEDFPTTAIMNGGDWRDEVIYQVIIDRFADGAQGAGKLPRIVENFHQIEREAFGVEETEIELPPWVDED